MEPDDDNALFHPHDALEAKLGLGVLMSSILEGAHIFCTDVALLKAGSGGEGASILCCRFCGVGRSNRDPR